jgi:hypothetical protein
MPYSSDQSRDFDPQATADDDRDGQIDGVGRLVGELKEFTSYFISARWDGIKLSIRQVVINSILILLGLCIVAAFVVMGVVLLLDGMADGLGVLFGGRPWLGKLVAGGVLLGLLACGTILGMKRFIAKSRQKTVEKYESRKDQQRARFGRDVRQRSGEANR